MNEMTSALTWLPVFLVLGAVLHVVDHHIGTRIYRWWYNMTHRDPLPDDTRKGFVFQQPARARFQAAILLAAAQSALAAFGGANPIIEMLTVIVEVPVAMVGFYCGPFLDKIWSRKDTVFDTVDKIERGELSMTEEVRKISAEAVETLKDVIISEDNEKPEENLSRTPPPPSQATEDQEELEELNPRDLISKYTKGR